MRDSDYFLDAPASSMIAFVAFFFMVYFILFYFIFYMSIHSKLSALNLLV